MPGAKYATNWTNAGVVALPEAKPDPQPKDRYSAERTVETGKEKILELRPILLYREPSNGQQSHSVFFTRTAQMLSNPYLCGDCDVEHEAPMAFVKIGSGGSTPEHSREIEWGEDTLYILVDPYGNELVRCRGSATGGGLKSDYQKALQTIEGLQKQLREDLDKARDRIAREHHGIAVEIYREILEYRGYPAVAEAEKGLRELVSWGRTEIRRVTASDGPHWKSSRRLRQLADWFKGTELEAEIAGAQRLLAED